MQLNTALRYGIVTGIFSLLFIPFIVSKSMFFPFVTGKNFAFRIVVELIFGAWLVLAWRDAAYRPRFSWLAAAGAFFIGVMALADIFGGHPLRSFWSNYERMEGFVTLLHLGAYFIVAGAVLNTRLLWERFLKASLGVSSLVALYSIFQLLGFIVINQGGVRIDATFGNATYLAVYALFHVFFAAFFLAKGKEGIAPRLVYGALLLLNLFILFNTATRGAILAVVSGALLSAFILLFARGAPLLRRSALAIVACIVVAVGVFWIAKDTDFIRTNPAVGRLANLSLAEGTSRFLVWNMAWQGVKEHPVLGWGQDNFILAFNKHYDPRMYGQEPWFDRAHNIIFDWLIAGGFIGLAAYALMFAALLYAIWIYPLRHGGADTEVLSFSEKSILTGLVVAYVFQNLFVFDNIVSYILFVSILAFMHGWSHEAPPVRLPEWRIFDARSARHLVAPLAVLVVAGSLYFLNIREIGANRALIRGIDFRSAQQATSAEAQSAALEKNLDNFRRALSAGYLGRAEAREQLAQAATTLASAPIRQDIKQEFFSLARGELLAQIEEDPANARPRLFIASLLTTYNMPEETITHLEEALTVSPKKQDIYFLLANAYLNVGKSEKALEVTKAAFRLEESYDRARDFYAAMLIRTGQSLRAEELMKEWYGRTDAWRSPIVGAYADTGNFKRVAELWRDLLANDPNNAQAHISLGAAYVKLGEREKAVAEIEMAMELSPDFASQGEYFIREIKAGRNP